MPKLAVPGDIDDVRLSSEVTAGSPATLWVNMPGDTFCRGGPAEQTWPRHPSSACSPRSCHTVRQN